MSHLQRRVEKEKLVASTRPVRAREMQSTSVPENSFGNMIFVTQKKLQTPGRKSQIEDDNLVETVQNRQPSSEADRTYHVIYKPGQQVLVPDSTLQEMERIVNANIKQERSFYRFSSEFPAEDIPNKLDSILNKIEAVSDEPEGSLSNISVLNSDMDEVKEIQPLEKEIEPVIDLPSKITKSRKLYFRILGNYKDLPMPKFKIQQYNQDFIGESKTNYEQNMNNSTPKINSKFMENKAHITISAKLFKTPSVGFLNTFHNLVKSEPVDSFTVNETIYNFNNASYDCPFTISGKFLNEGRNKSVVPALSVQLNKKGAVNSKIFKKHLQTSHKKVSFR